MVNYGARKWWAIVAITLAVMAVGLDMTVLNLALPTLATSLHATTGQLEWFVDAYNLVIAAALLPGGLLGDRFGRKKVMIISLGLFGVGSLCCAESTSANMLIVSRIVLGLGAAALLPLAMSVLPVLFTEHERAKAMSLLMVGNMLAFPVGPILGGWLLANYHWGTVFLINVPVVLIAIVAVAILLPESRSEQRPKLDLIGLTLSSAGLVSVTYAFIRSGEHGWGDHLTIVACVLGIVFLAGLLVWERRVRDPLVDLSLFQSRGFMWGCLLATLTSFALFGLLFGVPQFSQDVQGANALGSGLRLLPIVVGLLLGAPLSAKSGPHLGAKTTVAVGFVILAVGLCMAATTSVGSRTGFTSTWLAIIGLGLGFALPATMDSALGALAPERSGIGSAVIMALRQVGSTIGVAVLGSVLSTQYRNNLNLSGVPSTVHHAVEESVSSGVVVAGQLHSAVLLQSIRTAFVHGLDEMFGLCTGIALFGAILAICFLPRITTRVGEGAVTNNRS